MPENKGPSNSDLTPGNGSDRPPKAPRPYSRHGLTALKARVKVRGLQAIDRRTGAARALLSWRKDLLADLGGEETVSAQQRSLVELVARTKLYVDTLDAWIMEQPGLVNGRRRAVLPVVRERQQLADSMARMLGQLGLERRPRPVDPLDAIKAKLEAARQGGGS